MKPSFRSSPIATRVLLTALFFLLAAALETAQAQVVTLSPGSLSFGSVAVGTTSPGRTVTLRNTSTTTALSVTSIVSSGNFAQTNTCGTSVAAGARCVITVTFKPAALGALTGSIVITDNASPATQTIALTGTGIAPITITPASHSFGSVGEGTTSAAYSFTVRNYQTQAAALTISTTAPFAQTNTCGASLAGNATCSISVTFSPTTAGAQTGSVTVTYTGTGSPQTVALTGSGVAPITITPASRAFASVTQGTTSAARTFTVRNNTTAAMPITVSSTNTEFAGTGCGTSLAAGASCTLSVTFTPAVTATGAQTGSIAVAYTGTGSPQSVSVTGTAVSPLTAQPTSITFSTTRNVGTPSAAHSVTINNNSTSAVAIGSIVASTAAYAITANTCTTSLAASASCTVTVVFTPAVVGTTTGTLTITYGTANSQLAVAMTGGAQVGNLVSLAITVPNASLLAGTSEQLTATGTYGNGTTGNITAAAAWTSSNTAVATVVSNTGVLTGVAAGTATITASATGSSGRTVRNTASVAVTGKTITAITVSAPAPAIYPLGTDQFTATASYSDGTSGPVTATFASSNTGAATISSTIGLATGVLSVAGGTTNITASLSGVSTSPAFVLTVRGVQSVAAAPAAGASASIFPFATAQFVATLNYTDGTTGVPPANSVTFASSNTGVATINSSSGLATGVLSAAGGTTNITANMTGIPSAAPVALNVYGVQSVAVTPANPTFPLGLANSTLAYGPTNNSVPFTATATYTDPASTTANVTSTATWQSSATTVATINTAGTATVTVPAGSLTTSNVSSTITATYGNSGNTLLTVQPPVLESIAACLGPYPSPSCGTSTASVGATLGLNATQQFSATGTYSDNSTQNLANATWAAHDPQEVNVNSAGLATVLATDNGPHAVTASFGTFAAYQNSNTAWITAATTAPISCPTPTIDMKLLVVNHAANGYADFPAIQQILNYVGTPYDVVDVTGAAPTLSDGACHGYYQGVIFANGGDFYGISSWQSKLISYEQTFKVRQVNWFDFPDPNFGLSLYTGNSIPSTSTYSASFTAAAAPIFFYANTTTPVAFSGAEIYLVPPSSAQGTAIPLLTDSLGNALSVVITYADGRQYLTNTFDSNGFLTHDLVLAYGLINWVTKGVFLGDYHVYASQQIDDFFFDDSEWIPSTPCLTNPLTQDRTPPDASNLPVFRVNTADMTQLSAWQNGVQNDRSGLFSQFKLTMAFNGVGTAGNGDWTGLTAPVIATSSSGGVATFVAQGFAGLPGQLATVANTTNAGGIFNGTWTILSVTSSATTTPGTTSFTATVAAAPDTVQAAETGATVTVPDDLTANLQSYQSNFHWISHTFNHPSTLNGLHKSDTGGDVANGNNPTDDIDLEILTNRWVASDPLAQPSWNLDTDLPADSGLKQLTFTDFNPANIVTPGITGLNDPNVPGYLFADGILYAVSDTSVIGQPNNGPNPSPNVGIVSTFNNVPTGIYEVPRHPNDIFYNAASWADDQAEFVCIYQHYVPPNVVPVPAPAPLPPFNTYNAAQILDFTSSIFVTNMLMGDMDPQMFHQPDLHFSDNYPALTATPFGPPNPPVVIPGLVSPHVSALITDTYDQTFIKYKALYNLPVLSPTLDQLGVLMQNRDAYNLSGVTASMIGVGSATPQIQLSMPPATSTSPATAVIPVTGLTSTGSESYGGQNISHINMTPGQTITVRLP